MSDLIERLKKMRPVRWAAVDEQTLKDTIAALKAAEDRITELKKLADPLTQGLYKEMCKRHTEIVIENKRLYAALKRIKTLAENNQNYDFEIIQIVDQVMVNK